jgi:hypothetical protein
MTVIVGLLGLSLIVGAGGPAWAIPVLQIYIEDSTYNAVSETWEIASNDFRLWVLGDVGSYGSISDVKLTAVYASGLTPTLSLTPVQADPDLLPSPDDPSVPSTPTMVSNPASALAPNGTCGDNGTDGTIPCLGNSTTLPKHGEYGAGKSWQEFALGNFTLTDSPIGDFISSVPTSFPSTGQINAYRVQVSGVPDGSIIHFDAFNTIIQNSGNTKVVFAPFSHDAGGMPQMQVPLAPAVGLVLAGLMGLAATRVRNRRLQ